MRYRFKNCKVCYRVKDIWWRLLNYLKKDDWKKETYVCAICKEKFTKGWSDKEAFAEKKELWGDLPIEECDIICDDCFNLKFVEYFEE